MPRQVRPLPGSAGDEQALAKRYAPVVRLVEQKDECGPGEPYKPMDVDALFGQPTVALRGPWNGSDLVKIGPTAHDLADGLYEYHLDFPGDALNPGCGYERWARRVSEGYKPKVYAHVATDPVHPGRLALQYWPTERLNVRAGPAMVIDTDPEPGNAALAPGGIAAASFAVVRAGSFVLDVRFDTTVSTASAFGTLGIGVNVN